MKRFVNPGALSVCAGAFVLSGCGGSQGLLGQQPAVKSFDYGSNISMLSAFTTRRELLAATRTQGSIRCRINSDLTVSIHSKGDASGPFPGTFVASGAALLLGPEKFNGSFTITSGSQMISGTMQGDLQPPMQDEVKGHNCTNVSSAKDFTYTIGSRTRKASMMVDMSSHSFTLRLRDFVN